MRSLMNKFNSRRISLHLIIKQGKSLPRKRSISEVFVRRCRRPDCVNSLFLFKKLMVSYLRTEESKENFFVISRQKQGLQENIYIQMYSVTF